MKGKLLILLLLVFTLCLRLQNFAEVFDSRVYYYEYDPYYHMRLVEAIVLEGYRPDFDYYINYPYGLRIDWPPLFDYILATPGIIFGFEVSEVFAVIFPPILGLLSVLWIYLISLEVTRNEKFALISAFIFSACPIIVWRSLLGFADHHIWVIFLLLLSIWLILKPGIWKLFSGVPLLLMAFSWLGTPIYAALLAISSLLHFNQRDLRLIAVSYLLPAFSVILNPFLGISFIALFAFLLLGSFVRQLEEKFKRATLAYLVVCAVALLLTYFLPFGWFGFVKSGINYLFGAEIYLPTIQEARQFQVFDVITGSGHLFFILAIPALLMLKNRFLQGLFIFSLILSLMQVRFNEVLAIPTALLASYTICQILERLEYPIFEPNEEEKKSREKEKRNKRKNKKTVKKITLKDHATVTAFLLLLALPCFVVSLAPMELTKDWKEALNWMNSSLEPQNYLNPYEKPEYAVLSWWDYGNWILYVAKKAVVCNNFQAGAEDAAKFFTAQSEDEAMKIVKKRGVRYVVTAEELTVKRDNKTKFTAIMQIAGYNAELMKKEDILNFFNQSMLYKLHVENAEKLKHFRLLKEFGSVKVFEVVETV